MKAFLMHRDRDFDVRQRPQANWPIVRKDLALDVLIEAMAAKDKRVREVAEIALFSSNSNNSQTIAHRQGAVTDCLRNPEVVRTLYALAQEAIERQNRVWGFYRDYPSGRLNHAVETMLIFVDVLKRVRAVADSYGGRFTSEAFRTLFATLAHELDDQYFATVDEHLKRLKFRRGVLMSATLGQGLRGLNYVLRRRPAPEGTWFSRLFEQRPRSYKLTLAPRDEAGARAMSELQDRGVAIAADALSRSSQHIVNFFEMLQTELAFYVGCLNLHNRLSAIGAPFVIPSVDPAEGLGLAFQELYDIGLALSSGKRPVGNELNADAKTLIVVTGANQGGKTTFLRSVGSAHVMMQSGMFAPAEQFRASLVGNVFTHLKREEDATMSSGKFDEELSRMNDIVDQLSPRSLLLFNESFSSTNEREGSEIATQIVSALLEKGHRVLFVSHQFAFSNRFYEKKLATAVFLRANRLEDGIRTFKLVEGAPLSTSFGKDVYKEVFLTEGGPPERPSRTRESDKAAA